MNKNGDVLADLTGVLDGPEPQTIKGGKPAGFDLNELVTYEVVRVNGIADVVVHRVRGPVFEVSDDPVVRGIFGVK